MSLGLKKLFKLKILKFKNYKKMKIAQNSFEGFTSLNVLYMSKYEKIKSQAKKI